MIRDCDVAIGIRGWFWRSECATPVSIEDDGVDFVETAKEIPDVFCGAYDHVSQPVEDEFVIRLSGEFLFEERSNNGPSFPISRNFL